MLGERAGRLDADLTGGAIGVRSAEDRDVVAGLAVALGRTGRAERTIAEAEAADLALTAVRPTATLDDDARTSRGGVAPLPASRDDFELERSPELDALTSWVLEHSVPERAQIEVPLQEQLIVEFYSK